jgi:hypothetical protein
MKCLRYLKSENIKFIQFRFLCYLILFYFFTIKCDGEFGYISYSTLNIGDDIQAIAAKNFLPQKSIGIDREFVHQFNHTKKINVIMNGWYMITKNFNWCRDDIPAPEKSWPPSNLISPLLISIHFAKKFVPLALTDEGIAYLKKYGPVGARDLNTLNILQKNNIPSYFSGCLTLTLENDCKKRDKIIYAVDIDDECVKFIKFKTKYKVEEITHKISKDMQLNYAKRLKYAEGILEKYKKAKCVITSRLHAALPCLAFETPVLLIKPNKESSRFEGLGNLIRSCTKKELLTGCVNFSLDKPTENSKLYVQIRENLIRIVTEWVKCNSKN